MGEVKRWPPIVAGLLGFTLCIVVFWVEGSIFLHTRAGDFRDASTGDMLTANDGVGHCVQYVKPSDFKDRYDDDSKIGVVYPFAFPIGYGGEEVKCESDEVREALGVVTAASVHALQYNFAQGSPSDALRHTRMAAVAVALGYNGEVNFTNVYSALSELEEPPTLVALEGEWASFMASHREHGKFIDVTLIVGGRLSRVY